MSRIASAHLAGAWSLTTHGWQRTETVRDMIRGAGRIPRAYLTGSLVQQNGFSQEDINMALDVLLEDMEIIEDRGTLIWVPILTANPPTEDDHPISGGEHDVVKDAIWEEIGGNWRDES